jgi:hypothetical protein
MLLAQAVKKSSTSYYLSFALTGECNHRPGQRPNEIQYRERFSKYNKQTLQLTANHMESFADCEPVYETEIKLFAKVGKLLQQTENKLILIQNLIAETLKYCPTTTEMEAQRVVQSLEAKPARQTDRGKKVKESGNTIEIVNLNCCAKLNNVLHNREKPKEKEGSAKKTFNNTIGEPYEETRSIQISSLV